MIVKRANSEACPVSVKRTVWVGVVGMASVFICYGLFKVGTFYQREHVAKQRIDQTLRLAVNSAVSHGCAIENNAKTFGGQLECEIVKRSGSKAFAIEYDYWLGHCAASVSVTFDNGTTMSALVGPKKWTSFVNLFVCWFAEYQISFPDVRQPEASNESVPGKR